MSLTHMQITILIQREVILGVAEFLRSTCDEDVILPKEVLKASNLEGEEKKKI